MQTSKPTKKKMGIGTKILIGIGVLILIGIIANSGSDSKDNTSTEQSIPTANIPTDENTIGASALLSRYNENEVKADNDFKNKKFYVKGTVQQISKDAFDDIYITLGNDDFKNVMCYFDNSAEVADLKPGEIITVNGTCDGLVMGSVMMKKCTINK